AIDRSGYVGVAISVSNRPDFFAGPRVIGNGTIGSGADDLVLAIDLNYQRSGVGLISFPGTFPTYLAGALIQGYYILDVVAVTANNQEITEQDGGTARTMAVVIFKVLSLPNDVSGTGDAGGAVGAEMEIHAIFFQNRRGRGVTVLVVNGAGIS